MCEKYGASVVFIIILYARATCQPKTIIIFEPKAIFLYPLFILAIALTKTTHNSLFFAIVPVKNYIMILLK